MLWVLYLPHTLTPRAQEGKAGTGTLLGWRREERGGENVNTGPS